MKFYIDDEFKCHVENDGTMREIEDICFDGKCAAYVEGFRYIPDGETWTREDGEVFHGEMIAPWKSYSELDAEQRKYERQKLLEYENMQSELNTSYQEGVNSI